MQVLERSNNIRIEKIHAGESAARESDKVSHAT